MNIPNQESRGHIQPRYLYFLIALVLLFLTIITVLASYVNWGEMIGGGFSTNLAIAMLIASFKAYLVLMYFMHMRYENFLIWSLGLAYPIFLFLILVIMIFIDVFLRVSP